MLDLTIFIIKNFGVALGNILNVPVLWTGEKSLHIYDIVIYIALIFLFIKLFAMITKNSVVNKKG